MKIAVVNVEEPMRNLVRWSAVMILAGTMVACATVDTVMLTSQTFTPKNSAEEIEILDQRPNVPYLQLAELTIRDTSLSFDSMQRKILKKAAALGADAVVFSKPQTTVRHQVAYQPMYNPWGYYGPYARPWSWGYGGFGYGGWGYGRRYGPWGGGGYGGMRYGQGPWGGYGANRAVPYDVTTRILKGTAIKYTEK